jgi:uncharacterized membrane protein YkvA (DUF1232 family)
MKAVEMVVVVIMTTNDMITKMDMNVRETATISFNYYHSIMKRVLTIILTIKNDIIFLYNTLFNPNTKTIIKIAIIGMIIYVLSPIDILNDMFPIIGQLDDIAVILFVTNWIKTKTKIS